MPRVFIAAGSNVEPERNLEAASAELVHAFPDIRFSPWYQNRAVGFDGPDFVNYAAGFATELSVPALLEVLHGIESRCGRPREAPKWAPRAMDLDVLLYGDLVCETQAFKIPRPDLLRRAYMLGPLADIAAEVLHPTEGVTIGELWRRFDRGAHHLERLPQGLTTPHSGRRPPPESDR